MNHDRRRKLPSGALHNPRKERWQYRLSLRGSRISPPWLYVRDGLLAGAVTLFVADAAFLFLHREQLFLPLLGVDVSLGIGAAVADYIGMGVHKKNL